VDQSTDPTNNGTVTFTPDNNTPDTVFYESVDQTFMGNAITITPALGNVFGAAGSIKATLAMFVAVAAVATSAMLL